MSSQSIVTSQSPTNTLNTGSLAVDMSLARRGSFAAAAVGSQQMAAVALVAAHSNPSTPKPLPTIPQSGGHNLVTLETAALVAGYEFMPGGSKGTPLSGGLTATAAGAGGASFNFAEPAPVSVPLLTQSGAKNPGSYQSITIDSNASAKPTKGCFDCLML